VVKKYVGIRRSSFKTYHPIGGFKNVPLERFGGYIILI